MPVATASRAERVALAVLSLGAVAVVLAALPYKAFELDRFFVPKELVLYVTTAVTALLCLRGLGWVVPTRVDVCLAGYLVLGLASALAADNWWLAGRSLGISLAGVALFWVARALAHAGLARPLLSALAVAVVAAAATALLQAYGVENEYVSLNRAPGGTLGNRNFVAHIAAIGVPALCLCALTAQRALGAAAGAAGLAAVSAMLVLSRSRAAWLALVAAGALVVLARWGVRGGRRGARWPAAPPRVRRRVAMLAVATAAAVAAATLLPNSLRWKSDSPYLDSVLGVVNYRGGSGHGRLVQYRTTLRMAAAHPLLGVGPGNWPVGYPRFASHGDPSLGADGMTANPWPSSDWMAILAERGAPALLLLALALLGLTANAWVRLREARTLDDALSPLALGATVAVAVAVGAFDAVLLLPAPTLIVWPLLGALSRPRARRSSVGVPDPRGRAAVLVAILGALLVARSALQIAAMAVYSDAARLRRIAYASRLDPGSYRIQIRLASAYAARGECGRARPYASRARALFPSAPEPNGILRACRATTSAARD